MGTIFLEFLALISGSFQYKLHAIASKKSVLLILMILSVSCLLLSLNTTASAMTSEQTTEIVLGMSTALSGPAADLGKNMLDGIQAGLLHTNRNGNSKTKHRLRVLALDDGYEPTRTAPNMRQLIEKDKVLAIIGNVGTPTAIAAIPIANETKTLLFAPYTGAGVLRKTPPDRYVINYRASYAEETATMVDALIDRGGLKLNEIAFFTQRDGYGDSGYSGGVTALKRHGLQDVNTVVHTRYERNTLGVEGALANILLAPHPIRAVIMVGAYAPCAKFIKMAREIGLNALFLNVSFVGSTPLAQELGETIEGVIVTQVVPHPADMSLQIVRDYREDLLAYNRSATSSFGGLEGYIAARIFITALENINGPPTREGVIDALEQLGRFDIGLGDELYLGPKEHQASHRIWPTLLQDGTFVPFEWRKISDFFSQGQTP